MTILDEMASLLNRENSFVTPRTIEARALTLQTPHGKANRADGTWLEVDFHVLTFDVWYRVEGLYIPATEFDAEERPDVTIARCELYGSELNFHALPREVRLDIIEACREYQRDAT